jgi:hypothetical protein
MNIVLASSTAIFQRGRRALAFLFAIAVASLAFGVGMPWILGGTSSFADELWASQMQPAAVGAARGDSRQARP